MHLIDTNIAIHLRDGKPNVLQRFVEHDGPVAMSALTLAELERGNYKQPELAAQRVPRLAAILRTVPVVSFDALAAHTYGRIIAQCGWVKGRDFDRMIAAQAMSLRATLVSDNVADFSDIPGLDIANWNG
jgi:predicted nucleic acid-binding protein